MNHFEIEIAKLVEKAKRDWESESLAQLSEEEIEEMGGTSYSRLGKALRSALNYVHELRNHDHDWNEEDICNICGNDGRA
jgi:hypothetical protein